MEKLKLRKQDEFIRLGQAMKKAGMTMTGAEAHRQIEEGYVTVNGDVEVRRGRKLYPEDVFVFENRQVMIER